MGPACCLQAQDTAIAADVAATTLPA